MIFMSKNEAGIPKYELIQKSLSTVTRRIKPQPVGAIRAIQPGRTKAGVGHIRIISCYKHTIWSGINLDAFLNEECKDMVRQEEAKKEGFASWEGLMNWFNTHKIDIDETYRIEFVKVD